MNLLAGLFPRSGTLTPELRAALEAEGLVLVEEKLGGSVRYSHYKAPGKRFNGKVVAERMAIGISEERFVVYCRSGRVKLLDTPFSNPRLEAVEISAEGNERVIFTVDYDRFDVPNVSGQIAIHAKTPNAAEIVDQLRARLAKHNGLS